MSSKQFIMKCCICGREKTDRGWEFRPLPAENDVVFSHGFCTFCYETELMKIKFRSAMSVAASDTLYK